MADLRDLDAQTQEILDGAREEGLFRVALMALAQRRANLELLAKTRGAFDRAIPLKMHKGGTGILADTDSLGDCVHVYIPDNGRDGAREDKEPASSGPSLVSVDGCQDHRPIRCRRGV